MEAATCRSLDNEDKVRPAPDLSMSTISTHPSPPPSAHAKAADFFTADSDNFQYFHGTEHGDIDIDRVDLRTLRRKIDWHIVPIMFLCYTMQFLDKVNINYAAVMGLNADLKLSGNDFSNASTAFFIAYLIAEVPNGYLLRKVPAGKWLGLNVAAWGIVTASMAATTNYRSLLITRILLGVFEAAIAPCLMLIGSQWYTRSEQAPRFSFWYCGLGFAQIVGGVISFAFQQVAPSVLAGWKIMFIVLGLVTLLIGVMAALIIPDSPTTATFLTGVEKAALLRHVGGNRSSDLDRRFEFSQLLELIFDMQIWLLTLITILISISSGVVTSYSSTIIKQFGYTSPIAALLNVPSGLVSLASNLAVGYGVRHISHRWAWLVGCCVPGILGGALLSFAPKTNQPALLTGLYLVNAITATLVILYQWTMANVCGRTKRVAAATLVAASFSVGNIIGPQTFQARDAPGGYRPAKITVLATQAAGATLAMLLFAYYVWANRRRERRRVGEGHDDARIELNARLGEEFVRKDITDLQDASFRYVY